MSLLIALRRPSSERHPLRGCRPKTCSDLRTPNDANLAFSFIFFAMVAFALKITFVARIALNAHSLSTSFVGARAINVQTFISSRELDPSSRKTFLEAGNSNAHNWGAIPVQRCTQFLPERAAASECRFSTFTLHLALNGETKVLYTLRII